MQTKRAGRNRPGCTEAPCISRSSGETQTSRCKSFSDPAEQKEQLLAGHFSVQRSGRSRQQETQAAYPEGFGPSVGPTNDQRRYPPTSLPVSSIRILGPLRQPPLRPAEPTSFWDVS